MKRAVQNLWKFDGDYYRVQLPTLDMWLKLMEITLPAEWVPVSFLVYNQEYQRFMHAAPNQTELSPLGETSEKYYMVRPVLVPLNSDLEDISREFQADNPDGVIVSGGVPVYVDIAGQKDVIEIDNPVLGLPCINQMRQVSVVDSGFVDVDGDSLIEPLKWLCLNGCLVCMWPLWKMQTANCRRENILPLPVTSTPYCP